MIWLALLLMATLTAFCVWIFESAVHPASMFAAIWTACLFVVGISGDLLYPISFASLTLFIEGAVAFALGGYLVDALMLWNESPDMVTLSAERQAYVRRCYDFMLLACTAGFPFYVKRMIDMAAGSSAKTFLAYVRAKSIMQSNDVHFLDPIGNLAIVSMLIVSGIYLETDKTFARRWRLWLAILLAVAYGVFSGSKAGAVIVLLSLYIVRLVRLRKDGLGGLAKGILIAGVMFCIGLLAVNFAYSYFRSNTEVVQDMVKTTEAYSVGSLTLFENIMDDPNQMESTQSIDRFFLQTANSFGTHFYVPFLHAKFLPLSPDLSIQQGNTYTLYFTYYKDWGWAGTFFWLTLVGAVSAMVYRYAQEGRYMATVMYGQIACAIAFSFSSDKFFNLLNQHGKLIIIMWFLYTAPMIRFAGGRGLIGGLRPRGTYSAAPASATAQQP